MTLKMIPVVKIWQIIFMLLIGVSLLFLGCDDGGNKGPVETGDTVKVHYTGRLEDGSVFDSSEGKDPLEFTVGGGQMIKGFDEAVVGMETGETKTVTLPPEEAYGLHRDDLVWTIGKDSLAEGIDPVVGMKLYFTDPNLGQVPCVITAISENTITVDANHSLAGKTLIFDIEMVEIE